MSPVNTPPFKTPALKFATGAASEMLPYPAFEGNSGDTQVCVGVQSFLKNVKKSLVTPCVLHYSSPPNLTKPMEKLMIRHVLMKLGFLRSALAVGVGIPFVVASVAFAQEPGAPQGPATRAPVPAPNTAANTPTVPANNAGGGEASTERVVVTGSYIPTAETESALP